MNAEFELLPRGREVILFFQVDGEAIIVEDVHCLVAGHVFVPHHEQVVERTHIKDGPLTHCLAALLTLVFQTLLLLVSELCINLVSDGVPLRRVRQQTLCLLLEAFDGRIVLLRVVLLLDVVCPRLDLFIQQTTEEKYVTLLLANQEWLLH